MDQYLIHWANKVQGVTKFEYLNIQNDAGIESEEPQDFTSGPCTGEVVRNVQFPDLPTVKELPPFPPYSNPFHHDAFNMGCDISGPWMAMYREHGGLKQAHNKTDADKQSKLPVFYDDPQYIILVNQKTGQRFQLTFPTVAVEDEVEVEANTTTSGAE
jgi:hypothetical protein